MKKVAPILILLSVLVLLAACATEAGIASQNTSKAADQFEVERRIVFYNGITGDFILVIEGRCALGNADPAGELSVICKVGDGAYKKHFLGLSDNVTYFAEQLEPAQVNVYHYRVIFRPSEIVPDIDLELP